MFPHMFVCSQMGGLPGERGVSALGREGVCLGREGCLPWEECLHWSAWRVGCLHGGGTAWSWFTWRAESPPPPPPSSWNAFLFMVQLNAKNIFE